MIAFTNGCFDILHIGHIKLLSFASKQGDRLVVGLNSDASVRKLKGAGRPLTSESDRVSALKSLDCVDEVIVFEEDTPYELIKEVKPDVIVKGGDYDPEKVVAPRL